MKRFLAIILFFSAIAMFFQSCERNCYCKNLETGTESIYYGAYSKQECREVEEFYVDYECTYK